jgi:hypothetical protein
LKGETMAERRMFAKTIIDSDAFLEMPQSTQNLYFHLSMRADDDGFVNNPKSIMKQIGSQDDDIKVLIGKKFILAFESGVIVIKHWKLHNYIAKDRYKETKYKEEMAMLSLDENNSYTLNKPCIQDVYKPYTQVRLGKDSIYLLLINKYNETKPINYGDKIKKIAEIRAMKEYEELDQEQQEQLFNEMMKGGEL